MWKEGGMYVFSVATVHKLSHPKMTNYLRIFFLKISDDLHTTAADMS